MNKTKLAALLAVILTVSLAGCGKNVTEDVIPAETTTAAAETETQALTDTDAPTETEPTDTLPQTEATAAQTSAETAASTTAAAATTKKPAATTRARVSSGSSNRTTPVTQPPATEAPTPAPTQAPEPQTEATLSPAETPIEPPAGWTWYLEDGVYDGEFIAVAVKVREDPGIYGYNMNLSIDGKSIPEAGFSLVEVEQGDAYSFGTFLANLEKGNAAGAEKTLNENRVAGQDATVVTYYLEPPADAQPGQVYTVTITGLSAGNFAGQKFDENYGIQLGSATITIPEA